jgi:predicted PurR-regulated permease PerM
MIGTVASAGNRCPDGLPLGGRVDQKDPDSLKAPGSGASAALAPRNRALDVLAFAAVLGLLYAGRDVLMPITVALMLSLLVAPLVRRLRRLGLSQTPAVLVAVLLLALAFFAAAAVLGTQVLRMASGLPQYERTIQQKLSYLDEITLGRVDALTTETSRLVESHSASAAGPGAGTASASSGPVPLPVEIHPTRTSPLQVIARVLASVWQPIASTGIVLVVLVFVLLEHEAMRDRFIRVIGGTNIRLTTAALNDAGERLSRFFVSQFAVNLGVGVTIGVGLALLGVPQAFLWGALATLLRFVPYIGVWLAALMATGLATAVDPGWSLAISTLVLFAVVELTAGQVIEPNLYGHTTGLSPLSVVVAAIFWSAIWGPLGLVLSTPLTLCLLVLGRHIRALNFLDLLLGESQALTLAQRFYQRALSGDADEILGLARGFLKRNSFAAYCDQVLMPALHLVSLDRDNGAITQEQLAKMRNVLVQVVSDLGNEPRRLRRPRLSVLDDQNPGLILRQHREQLLGRWQGPIAVPPGSVLLCIGLATRSDTIAAELLVRALREQDLDARHVLMADVRAGERPPDAKPESIGVVYLVSAFPSLERDDAQTVIDSIQRSFPAVRIVTVFLPGILVPADLSMRADALENGVSSFEAAAQLCTRSVAADAAAPAAAAGPDGSGHGP